MPEEAIDHTKPQCFERPDGLKSYYVGGQVEWDIPHDGKKEKGPFTRHGMARNFYPNGQPHIQRTYVDGKIQGVETEWYPDGKVACQITFVDDVRHGPYARWHPNGEKDLEGKYVNGELKGWFRRWDEQGKLWLEQVIA